MTSKVVHSSPLLSLEETASYLGMSKSWCYQHLKKYCPYEKIGGALKYLKEDLDRFIESQRCMPLDARDVRSFVGLGEDNGKTILQKK
jgi:predicted DNA-binding transcriptional regulator AlpA